MISLFIATDSHSCVYLLKYMFFHSAYNLNILLLLAFTWLRYVRDRVVENPIFVSECAGTTKDLKNAVVPSCFIKSSLLGKSYCIRKRWKKNQQIESQMGNWGFIIFFKTCGNKSCTSALYMFDGRWYLNSLFIKSQSSLSRKGVLRVTRWIRLTIF